MKSKSNVPVLYSNSISHDLSLRNLLSDPALMTQWQRLPWTVALESCPRLHIQHTHLRTSSRASTSATWFGCSFRAQIWLEPKHVDPPFFNALLASNDMDSRQHSATAGVLPHPFHTQMMSFHNLWVATCSLASTSATFFAAVW